MTSTPSPGIPHSPLQSEKSRRYDRQLRLWGDHGQNALEYASICMINASAIGTEILKSLVLPGVGSFTILDQHKLTAEDAGNNFFLDPECIGQSRGEVAMRLLLELNHEVRGDCVQQSVEQVLEMKRDFFSSFSLVVCCGLPERSLLNLAKILWTENIPLVTVKTAGFLGYMRLQVREHFIVETHPDSRTPDLRLENPWPELETWLQNQVDKLESMTRQEHSHTPYPVLLYRYLNEWRAEHNNDIPQNYKEKTQFKENIRKGLLRREGNEEFEEDEENFEEACKAVNTVIKLSSIPSNTMTILQDPCASNLHSGAESFWLIAHAVGRFVDLENRLPVEGLLPDMFSDSARDVVSEADVRRFCRESRYLRLERGCSLEAEYTGGGSSTSLQNGLEDPDSDALYYLVLRAVDRYISEYGSTPGDTDPEVEADTAKLKTIFTRLCIEAGLTPPQGQDDHIHEVCRYGGSELHTVAAFLGGCAAHECIKLLTGQYVPIDNIVVYNAITSNVSTFKV
ncbi:NEDD8-activating enzyme E1 regulatory subunit isoform X2 [Eurytemora carolleeae]|uniref:NEDD8-activating enzyme E1 regulatory subunit isoform X2 n=1 Tax=Eurytemora carolleeae TaxID=1294199 RepID=UPI000C76A61B|nr:NEDD8-activating enzyme E1 regulatory subunit isoform X2 [Eurytemora carolleeae]|eukprot:XP_023326966.1 NEDD8-activating enzyme E1 regulatory subunit-like isoform X2 [Eurytemora affinis]